LHLVIIVSLYIFGLFSLSVGILDVFFEPDGGNGGFFLFLFF